MFKLLCAALGATVLSGCIPPEVIIEGRACPCPAGYVCIEATQTCSLEPGAGGADTTGTTGSTGSCMGLCGTSGCSPCPTTPVIDAGGFGIDAFEVSRGDYAVFLADDLPTHGQSFLCDWNDSFAPSNEDTGGCTDHDMSKQDFPVGCVDWCDAAAYCAWAGKRLCGNKQGPTLSNADLSDPAKSEWFDACSAGGTRLFPYGDTEDETRCNTQGQAGNAYFVGGFATCEGGLPGLFDMVGNVEEWEDGCDLSPDPSRDNCVLRGGAYWADGHTVTPTKRNHARCASTGGRKPDRSQFSHDWGFRCCSDL